LSINTRIPTALIKRFIAMIKAISQTFIGRYVL
jgi:hypothetical protein